ncbi:hypothetical protein [Pasteurella atlantica]|nr:hypothetical protein [Pasteurella atlantica]
MEIRRQFYVKKLLSVSIITLSVSTYCYATDDYSKKVETLTILAQQG